MTVVPRFALLAAVAGAFAGVLAGVLQVTDEEDPHMASVTHLNPEGMHHNPAFSQGVMVQGPHRTIYVGGQNAVDASGQIVGKDDFAAQSAQVARNLSTVLQAAGATVKDVIKWSIYVVDGQPLHEGFQVFQREWGLSEHPPTISVVFVAGLAHPDFLLEIDAVAVVPEQE